MSPEAFSAIAAWASAFVAFCALIFAAWQCIEARAQRRETERQNRMSVRPLLSFTRSIMNLEKQPIGIFLTNSGLGPATIRKIVVVDRVSKTFSTGERALSEIFVPLTLSREGMINEVQHFWLDQGSGVRPGETFRLICVAHGSKYAGEMIKLMARVNIKIEYESMYEEGRPLVYLWDTPEDFEQEMA